MNKLILSRLNKLIGTDYLDVVPVQTTEGDEVSISVGDDWESLAITISPAQAAVLRSWLGAWLREVEYEV
jgi:hypothetical protein